MERKTRTIPIQSVLKWVYIEHPACRTKAGTRRRKIVEMAKTDLSRRSLPTKWKNEVGSEVGLSLTVPFKMSANLVVGQETRLFKSHLVLWGRNLLKDHS